MSKVKTLVLLGLVLVSSAALPGCCGWSPCAAIPSPCAPCCDPCNPCCGGAVAPALPAPEADDAAGGGANVSG